MVKRLVILFISSVIFFALTLTAGLYLRADSSHDNCEGVNEVRIALQSILIRSQTLASQNPDYTPTEKEAATDFYNRAIRDLEPRKC